MTTITAAKVAVYQWLSDELPTIAWRFANQNSPGFKLSDAQAGIGTIDLLRTANAGRGVVKKVYNAINDNFDAIHYAYKQLTFSVNVYAKEDTAFSFVEQIKSSLYFSETTNHFNENAMGFISCSDIRNLTGIISAQFEYRAQADIDFYALITHGKQVDRIAEITIKGDIDDGRVMTQQTFTFD